MTRTRKFSKSVWLFALAVFLAAPSFGQDPDQKPAQAPEFLVPAGTVMPIVLSTYLNTKNTQVGDTFYADSTYPIWIQQRLVVPRGSIIKGTVTEVMKPGKIQIVVGDPIDVSCYTIDTVQDLIDKTRQTIIANFNPDYTGKK